MKKITSFLFALFAIPVAVMANPSSVVVHFSDPGNIKSSMVFYSSDGSSPFPSVRSVKAYLSECSKEGEHDAEFTPDVVTYGTHGLITITEINKDSVVGTYQYHHVELLAMKETASNDCYIQVPDLSHTDATVNINAKYGEVVHVAKYKDKNGKEHVVTLKFTRGNKVD